MSSLEDPMFQNNSGFKSFAILGYLVEVQAPKDLDVISNELRMNKSTVYRFLATLVQLGYVTQNPVFGQYAPGPKVVRLASGRLDSLHIRSIARPLLEQLVSTTSEAVQLAVLDNFEVVYIDKLDGHRPVRMISTAGGRMPAHSTGLGKALLANQTEEDWQLYVEKIGLTSYTSNTIHDPETFYRELRSIREKGYAIDNCESEEGTRCVAVPIQDHLGNTVAAISISGWSLTMTPDRDAELEQLVKQTAIRISELLGAT